MGKIISTSLKEFALCGALGFCGASLLILLLTTTRSITGTETLFYFFTSWILFSAVAWMGWKW